MRGAFRSGRSINLPAQLFWLISITVLSPLALVSKDFNQAILIPLIVHWAQYVGLNVFYILNRYSSSPDSKAQLRGQLAYLIIPGTICVAIFFYLGTQVTTPLATGLIFGIGFVHYIQDAFLWRFRDPVLRQELLVFLKPGKADHSSLQPILPVEV
jgi:hypothetical protein